MILDSGLLFLGHPVISGRPCDSHTGEQKTAEKKRTQKHPASN